MNNSKRLSRRGMLKGSSAALAALGLLTTTGFGKPVSVYANQKENLMADNYATKAKPRIVLVHGAFADGTGWQRVIPPLEEQGYVVTAVQNPMTSLANDIATTKRVLDAEAQKGPVIVVGHSYGGAVITGAAAGNPNVKALVYIAAFAPLAGEPVAAFLKQYPTLLDSGTVTDTAGFVFVDRAKFREIFAADVERTTAEVMAATQKPIFGGIFGQATAAAAWQSIPAWYLLTTKDHAINPDLERFYAKRAGATTVEIAANHAVFVSHPQAVVKLIEQAAMAVK